MCLLRVGVFGLLLGWFWIVAGCRLVHSDYAVTLFGFCVGAT